MLWFSSDTHFGHNNILHLCNRPFSSPEEMDEVMIVRWNECVQPSDTVYHLGDFWYKGTRSLIDYRRELKGNIVLIRGNHDKQVPAGVFSSVHDILSVQVPNYPHIVLCHYAMRVWPGSHRGAGHLYGHSHGRLPPYGKSFDVGVDANDFRPLALPEVIARFESLDENVDNVE